MKKYVIYVGEFDLRNKNVQSHLVLNNGKMFNLLGYEVVYIGVNRQVNSFSELENLPFYLGKEEYLELPNTFNFKGVILYREVYRKIINYLDKIYNRNKVEYLITYQAPTFSIILEALGLWCKKNRVKYIVNCADLPIFKLQSFIKRQGMELNWNQMYKINKKYANGIIAVSSYIEKFYNKFDKTIIIPPLFDFGKFQQIEYSPRKVTRFLYAGKPFVILKHEADPLGMKDRLDKIIDLFLEIIKKEVKFEFLVIGLTKEEYLTCVPRHRNILKNENSIVFIGNKTHKETLKMVSEADFTINFRDENLMTRAGFSTKIVESISMGTPVIINEIGDTFNYLIEDVTAFKLKEGDQKYNICLIEKLCKFSIEMRKKMKKNCYEQKTFDYMNYTGKFNKFLKEL